MGFFNGFFGEAVIFGSQKVDTTPGMLKSFQGLGLYGKLYAYQHGSFWKMPVEILKTLVVKIRHGTHCFMSIAGLLRITVPDGEDKTGTHVLGRAPQDPKIFRSFSILDPYPKKALR